MDATYFLLHLVGALGAALLGGFLARRIGLPVLVGYLLAGLAVGPHTPGFFADEAFVGILANLGVALLVFAVGVQFSLRRLLEASRIALLGGTAQILATILLGLLLGMALGWGVYGGIFLGCAIAHSSTAVMMRVLDERGELGSGHGTAMLSISIVQDLSLVAMVALLPSLATLGEAGGQALSDVAIALLRAVASVGITLVLALRIVPWILHRMAAGGSQELFLIVVLCICLLAAYLAQIAGLSLAIGAFLAGLVISESDFAHEIFSQVRPLRDVFASLFFVSIGMLLDPGFVLRNGMAVLAVVLTILIGKALLSALPIFVLGYHGRTAILVGLGLAQIGEFSFILAAVGIERGLIPPEMSSVILAAALITLLISPFAYAAGDPLYRWLNTFPAVSRLLNRPPTQQIVEQARNQTAARVVILGCGRVGSYVSDALHAQQIPQVVVDYDAAVVSQRSKEGLSLVYGDASSEVVLAQTHPEKAELVIVALPEAGVTEMAVRLIRRMAPDIQIVARVHRSIDIPAIREAGANAVIHAEFEASAEMVRQGLNRLDVPDPVVDDYLERMRQSCYTLNPS